MGARSEDGPQGPQAERGKLTLKHYTQRSQNDKMRGQLRGCQGLEMEEGT